MRKKRKTPLSRRGLPRRSEEYAELEPYPRLGELVDEKKISQKAAVEVAKGHLDFSGVRENATRPIRTRA
jgi:hypothetical protein